MPENSEARDQTTYRTVEGVAVRIVAQGESSECLLRGGPSLFLPRHLAAYVLVGSSVRCSVPIGSGNLTGEILIVPPSEKSQKIFRTRIAGASRPRRDHRGRPFVSASVEPRGLGIERVHITCTALRDYFYTVGRQLPWDPTFTLYQLLQVRDDISPGELRVAFNVASLEQKVHCGDARSDASIERAFNILSHPDLRACYNLLLVDPEGPVLFPYGGCGTLTAGGHLSPDGTIFFCHRIASFLPETRRRRLSVPIRRLSFFEDFAEYRDSRNHVEALFDRDLLRLEWDSSWNQWKHLLGSEIVVDAEFTQQIRWSSKESRLEPIRWESPLPSRFTVKLPGDVHEQIRQTKRRFHALGRLSDVVETIRVRLESEAIEYSELRAILQEAGATSDFDPLLISWQPNYDRFFYEELCRRADRHYFFRKEYIIETNIMLVVEIPSRGHATYLFSAPRKFREFMDCYAGATKDDIRTNKNGIAEKLGFVARIIHGRSRRKWLRAVQLHLGATASVVEPNRMAAQ